MSPTSSERDRASTVAEVASGIAEQTRMRNDSDGMRGVG
jgi:hypothetical protein